jgi:hypothetical protein
MKTKVISVLMLSMSLILVSCQYESQPTQNTSNTSDLETQGLSKKGGKLKPELIIFKEGDLEGNQTVFGCCPNAGPWPAYTMTLSGPFPTGISGIPLEGNIFMNFTGSQSPGDYIVQFWWGEVPNDYFIEIRGGEAHNDKRNKILTVIFKNAQCEILFNDELTETVYVSFTLIRAKQ